MDTHKVLVKSDNHDHLKAVILKIHETFFSDQSIPDSLRRWKLAEVEWWLDHFMSFGHMVSIQPMEVPVGLAYYTQHVTNSDGELVIRTNEEVVRAYTRKCDGNWQDLLNEEIETHIVKESVDRGSIGFEALRSKLEDLLDEGLTINIMFGHQRLQKNGWILGENCPEKAKVERMARFLDSTHIKYSASKQLGSDECVISVVPKGDTEKVIWCPYILGLIAAVSGRTNRIKSLYRGAVCVNPNGVLDKYTIEW